MKMWREAEFCHHEKEPLITTTIDEFSNPFGVVDHVMLVQPACKKCKDKKPFHQVKTEYYMCMGDGNIGREYNLKTPYQFWIEFSSQSYKRPDEKHTCDATGHTGVNFNRYGDLCGFCTELNSTTIKHDNGSETHIFLDKVFKEGPSNMNRLSFMIFYLILGRVDLSNHLIRISVLLTLDFPTTCTTRSQCFLS